MGREHGDCKLSELEDDYVDRATNYRTIHIVFTVKSFSDEDALNIGHALLQHMKDESIIGPADGNVVLGP